MAWAARLVGVGCLAMMSGCGLSAVTADVAGMGSSVTAAGGSTTWAGLVACSRAILWGDVAASGPSSRSGRVLVQLNVTEWVKPGAGQATVEYDLIDPEANGGAGINRPFVVGEHMMLRVPVNPDELVTGHYGEDAKLQGGKLAKAVPDAPAACGPEHPGG